MQEIFRAIPGVLQQLEENEAAKEALVFSIWRRVAGELLSEHTSPVAFEGPRLVVAVSSETWQKHLEDLAGQILFKLNSAVGTRMVDFIEFFVDRQTVAVDRTDYPIRLGIEAFAERAENEITDELKDAAASIADEDLRHLFLDAAGRCLVRRADRPGRPDN